MSLVSATAVYAQDGRLCFHKRFDSGRSRGNVFTSEEPFCVVSALYTVYVSASAAGSNLESFSVGGYVIGVHKQPDGKVLYFTVFSGEMDAQVAIAAAKRFYLNPNYLDQETLYHPLLLQEDDVEWVVAIPVAEKKESESKRKSTTWLNNVGILGTLLKKKKKEKKVLPKGLQYSAIKFLFCVSETQRMKSKISDMLTVGVGGIFLEQTCRKFTFSMDIRGYTTRPAFTIHVPSQTRASGMSWIARNFGFLSNLLEVTHNYALERARAEGVFRARRSKSKSGSFGLLMNIPRGLSFKKIPKSLSFSGSSALERLGLSGSSRTMRVFVSA